MEDKVVPATQQETSSELVATLLLNGTVNMTDLVPDDINSSQLLANIRASVSGFNKHEKVGSLLAAYLGRNFAVVAARLEVLKEWGYASIGDFEKVEVIEKGVSHGRGYAYKLFNETFPQLTINEIVEIGHDNLKKAVKVIKGKSGSQKTEIIEQAKKLSCDNFTLWLEGESGIAGPGETTSDSFRLIGTKAQVEELREWLAIQELQEWAGSDHPLTVILAALQSTTTEWQPDKQDEKVLNKKRK